MPCSTPAGCVFETAHQKWIAGDLEGFLAQFDDNIVWHVNIDGLSVPYAASAVGVEDLRWRLQHMMDTFSIDRFAVEWITHGAQSCRSSVHIVYVHRATGEPLDVKLRFIGWQHDGRLVRMEEQADAAYVEAYSRFVHHLETSREGAP